LNEPKGLSQQEASQSSIREEAKVVSKGADPALEVAKAGWKKKGPGSLCLIGTGNRGPRLAL